MERIFRCATTWLRGPEVRCASTVLMIGLPWPWNMGRGIVNRQLLWPHGAYCAGNRPGYAEDGKGTVHGAWAVEEQLTPSILLFLFLHPGQLADV